MHFGASFQTGHQVPRQAATTGFGNPIGFASSVSQPPQAGPMPQSSFGNTPQGTGSVPYSTTQDRDASGLTTITHFTAMQNFNAKSTEEWRHEDYKLKAQAPQQTGLQTPQSFGGFGAQTMAQPSQLPAQSKPFGQGGFGQQSMFGQTSTSQFGQPSQAGFGGFGQQTSSQSSGFGGIGQPSQTSQPSAFGQPSQGGFGGLQQPSQSPQPSGFGQPSQGGFGGIAQQPSQTSQPSAFGQPSQGGFGGIAQQPSQTSQPSVFGQPSQGGLFGTQQGNFGQASAQPGLGGQGGLFQSQTQSSQPSSMLGSQQASGLFNQPKPQAGGLFGQPTQQPQSQPQTTGLFNQSQSTGLLGSQQAPSTGLFSQQKPQTSQVGGLFSSQGAAPGQQTMFTGQSQPQTGSLFAPKPQGGLFSSTQTPQQSSLLSQPAQPAQQSSLFSQTTQQPNSLFNQQSNAPKPFIGQQQTQFQQTPAMARPAQVDNLTSAYKDPYGLSWLYPNSNPEEILKSNLEKHQQTTKDGPSSVLERILKNQKTPTKSVPNQTRWKKPIERRFDKRPVNLLDYRNSSEPEPFSYTKRNSFSNLKLVPYRTESNKEYFRANTVTPTPPQEPTFEISLRAFDPEPIRFVVPVQKTTPVSWIKSQVLIHIQGIQSERTQLIHKSRILQESLTVGQAGILPEDEISVIVLNSPPREQTYDFAPEETIPKLTKEGYKIKPSLVELARFKLEDLKRVKDFTIYNQHGKIVFEGETDLEGLNLDEVVEIAQNSVELYSDDSKKPPVGQGLNKPAIVHLYNCKYKKPIPSEIFKQKLKEVCEKNDTEFIDWSSETLEWVFRVKNF
mmetsp:Transcript_12854/g.18780  ORF Transcript_12854/g.18780 Transcript_12854/m.18780 type:complete len:834 (+) Transcript_12854:20-2521(+)